MHVIGKCWAHNKWGQLGVSLPIASWNKPSDCEPETEWVGTKIHRAWIKTKAFHGHIISSSLRSWTVSQGWEWWWSRRRGSQIETTDPYVYHKLPWTSPTPSSLWPHLTHTCSIKDRYSQLPLLHWFLDSFLSSQNYEEFFEDIT